MMAAVIVAGYDKVNGGQVYSVPLGKNTVPFIGYRYLGTCGTYPVLNPELRIRSIFGRIRIQQIRVLKTGFGSSWHLGRYGTYGR